MGLYNAEVQTSFCIFCTMQLRLTRCPGTGPDPGKMTQPRVATPSHRKLLNPKIAGEESIGLIFSAGRAFVERRCYIDPLPMPKHGQTGIFRDRRDTAT